jgi:outer membrane protein OmpA-like peptidoglycan-associated protein
MFRRAVLAALPAALVAACAGDRAELTQHPRHVVFFADDSTTLSAPALTVIQDASNLAKQFPLVPVRVLGFAAPATTSAPIAGLSAARAQAVAAELERFGIARGRIRLEPRGAVPFDSAEVESRRVEIRIGE